MERERGRGKGGGRGCKDRREKERKKGDGEKKRGEKKRTFNKECTDLTQRGDRTPSGALHECMCFSSVSPQPSPLACVCFFIDSLCNGCGNACICFFVRLCQYLCEHSGVCVCVCATFMLLDGKFLFQSNFTCCIKTGDKRRFLSKLPDEVKIKRKNLLNSHLTAAHRTYIKASSEFSTV